MRFTNSLGNLGLFTKAMDQEQANSAMNKLAEVGFLSEQESIPDDDRLSPGEQTSSDYQELS